MDCLANIKFLDALDQPINSLFHQLWVGSILISDHVTSDNGESVWIRRPVGTIIDVHIKSIVSGEYISKVKFELIGEKTIFIIRSPKILLKGVSLSAKDVATGTYVRSTYIVAEGDYLSRIADDNHTTTAELIEINKLKSGTDIHPGQVLKIPTKKQEVSISIDKGKAKALPKATAQKETIKIIVVQQTDSLALIAKLTGNTVDEIKKLNGLSDVKLVKNQKLKVYDRKISFTSNKEEKLNNKQDESQKSTPTVKQQSSKSQEQTPVAKVEALTPINAAGLLPEACGGERHYKRTLARIAELHSVYQPYVVKLINEGYKKLNICWVVTDGYRSPSAQDALPSSNTNAKGLSSYHQYGLAIDLYSVRDGQIVLYSNKLTTKQRGDQALDDHRKLGPIGEKLGLVWGGRWKSIVDNPHYELHPNGKTWHDLKPKLLEVGVGKYKKLKF